MMVRSRKFLGRKSLSPLFFSTQTVLFCGKFDAAQAFLGHANASTTEIYAELDFEKAAIGNVSTRRSCMRCEGAGMDVQQKNLLCPYQYRF